MIQQLINHVVFCLDKSGSMSHLSDQVVKVFDGQIEYLARRSKELNQETRVSVYLFSDIVENLVYDIDVLRLPSIKNYYRTGGSTALLGATLKSIQDLEKTSQLYGDHSFLIYVISDGENNIRNDLSNEVKKTILSLPDNWTLAILVPNQTGVFESKKFGFPVENISVWDASSNKGMEEAGKAIRQATDNFMVNRASGIRSTKSLFNLDTSNLTTTDINKNLVELRPNEYELLNVNKIYPIKDFIESWKLQFYKGCAYYEITKPETVQSYKQLIVQNKLNGKLYGGQNSRKLLNLPSYEVKVSPSNFGNFRIFCQSSSSNRKLVPGTQLVVLK